MLLSVVGMVGHVVWFYRPSPGFTSLSFAKLSEKSELESSQYIAEPSPKTSR